TRRVRGAGRAWQSRRNALHHDRYDSMTPGRSVKPRDKTAVPFKRIPLYGVEPWGKERREVRKDVGKVEEAHGQDHVDLRAEGAGPASPRPGGRLHDAGTRVAGGANGADQ